MDALELRIGNYIAYQGRSCRTKTIVFSLTRVGVATGNACNSERDLGLIHYSDCLPIDLNEEWLEAFGFTELNGRWMNMAVTIEIKNHKFYFSGIPGKDIAIRYVHELQNLAFALNKIDLKLDKFHPGLAE